MPVTTASAAVHISPVVIKTFFQHGKRRAELIKAGDGFKTEEAWDDIFYDQAFHIVKAFIELGTNNTVESLQQFTNTHVPSPPWAAVSPVCIPHFSCNEAADILIDWFGPEELKCIVGGERWWQIRGLEGIDAEWIAEKENLTELRDENHPKEKLKEKDANILKMESLETVMFYVHGGGYFWGSINTHRYQLIRYARETKARIFTVNYRKAPQYPWPCPLQDVLAAYMYLVNPPPCALHKAISPSKICFAGDSAGASLCITAMAVLRDLGKPLPAGAVLISPWVDLTHSFPSIISNAQTDIIPSHGFLARPSPVWPVDPLPKGRGRVYPTHTNIPPAPGHGDTLKPSARRLETDDPTQRQELSPEQVKSQSDMLDSSAGPDLRASHPSSSASDEAHNNALLRDTNSWEPKPPKVLMKDPNAIPWEIGSQIQLYATTEQLTHPLVSPILQGSLGGLPPLYILAGDGEMLRDEVIYLAHRAAHPKEYPARSGVLESARRQKENSLKFQTPTKVHLQIYDDMCHVPTIFGFMPNIKYAYRSISEFAKYITQTDNGRLERVPFPELRQLASLPNIFDTSGSSTDRPPLSQEHRSVSSDINMFEAAEKVALEEFWEDKVDVNQAKSEVERGQVVMIRERVNIRGEVRPMEPKGEMPVLKIPPSEVGLLKEEPASKWKSGQDEWDRKFSRSAKRVEKQRQDISLKADKLVQNARQQGLVSSDAQSSDRSSTSSSSRNERRWGPLDLAGETPPPTAIAGRRDSRDALALLKKLIYHTPPITHNTIPRLKAADTLKAAFDPHDDPVRPPQQSASEQQVHARLWPMHGLRIWDGLVGYFGQKTTQRALRRTKSTGSLVNATTGQQ
ncbi:alpha/beta-hydrolase [Pluteus cervinus]|uniref:Alpha/beta-hydrolase n=1 Tax=Pluteus cervinus TaxID=181527 RepID=A0ACD3B1X6_9AGAR|nr:alpha/beta-hydrolase [Pluteus cervinus]